MANFNLLTIIKRRNAIKINKLKKITSKIQRTSSSIGFIQQAVRNNFTLKFAEIKGQFIHEIDQRLAEKNLLKSYFKRPFKDSKKAMSRARIGCKRTIQRIWSLCFKDNTV